MRVCWRSAILMVSLLLLACSGAVTTQFVQYDASGVPELFRYGAVDRDFRTVIHGNPSAGTTEAFETAVIDAMQGHTWGRRTNFTTTPGKNSEKNLWVVMAFNADVGVYDLCERKNISTKTVKGPLRLQAAWCFNGREDSSVDARVDSASNTNDPRFRAIVQETVLNLFPTHMDWELIQDDGDKRGS